MITNFTSKLSQYIILSTAISNYVLTAVSPARCVLVKYIASHAMYHATPTRVVSDN